MYFPILKTKISTSFNHFLNISPSIYHQPPKKLYLYNAHYLNNRWLLDCLSDMGPNQEYIYKSNKPFSSFEVCFLSEYHLPKNVSRLPKAWESTSTFPEWRSTAGLKCIVNSLQTSYQGEMPTFDKIKTCVFNNIIPKFLTCDVYIIFISLHTSTTIEGTLSFYTSKYDLIKKFSVYSNKYNVISVSKELLAQTELFVVQDIGGIPYFLLVDESTFSIEHTHPPHSHVIAKQRKEFSTKYKTSIMSHL